MPHSFGCKATDWHCSVSSIRTFLKGYVISTFVQLFKWISVRHIYGGQFKSINKGSNTSNRHPPAGRHQLTAMPKNWQDFL